MQIVSALSCTFFLTSMRCSSGNFYEVEKNKISLSNKWHSFGHLDSANDQMISAAKTWSKRETIKTSLKDL